MNEQQWDDLKQSVKEMDKQDQELFPDNELFDPIQDQEISFLLIPQGY